VCLSLYDLFRKAQILATHTSYCPITNDSILQGALMSLNPIPHPKHEPGVDGNSQASQPGNNQPTGRDTPSPLENLTGPALREGAPRRQSDKISTHKSKGSGPQLPSTQSFLHRAGSWLKEAYVQEKKALVFAVAASGVSMASAMLAGGLVSASSLGNFSASLFSWAATYSWYPAFFTMQYFGSDKAKLQALPSEDREKSSARLLKGSAAMVVGIEVAWFGGYVGMQNLLHLNGLSTVSSIAATHLTMAVAFSTLIPLMKHAVNSWSGLNSQTKKP